MMHLSYTQEQLLDRIKALRTEASCVQLQESDCPLLHQQLQELVVFTRRVTSLALQLEASLRADKP